MKEWLETKNGILFCAVVCTIICLMYAAAACKMGIYAAFARPSFFFNGLLFGISAVLAVICWIRWLFCGPDHEKSSQKKQSRAFCWGVAAFSGLGALVCVLTYFFLERSNTALAAAAFLVFCGVILVRRGMKDTAKKD